MKKIGFLLATVIMLVLFAFSASAETEGYYIYKVKNGEATITDVSSSISGDVAIPSTLGGYPVTSIGNYAFEYCSSLKSVTIPDSVTSIGDHAFYDCYRLQSVTIPDSVTSIGQYAFLWCSSLESVTIPDSVTSIGSSAFHNCTSLKSVYAVDIESWLGISFDSYSSNPLHYAENLYFGNELVKAVIIPDSVTSIGDYAFRGCTSLTSITIPDSVTSIGSSAFWGCTSLTSITIPDSVTSIGSSAFSGCTSLTSITIPDSVTSIGSYAFEDCTSLKSVYAVDIESWLGISFGSYRSNPLCYAGNLYFGNELVKAVIIPDSVTSIGSYAFYKCKSLTSITIPDSVTSIGSEAFYNCTSLKSVYAVDIESWLGISFDSYNSNPLYYAGNLYFGNELVKAVIIPDSVTSIGDYAFYNCTGLDSITIPDSVTSIGSSAFSGCTSLTSITIPDSVTSIGSSAFYNCTSLTSITLPFVGASQDGTSNTHFGYIFGASSYSDNNNYVPGSLKEVIITAPCKKIGSYAFRGCTSLTNITIPDSVTSIDSYAFYNCTSLTNITIPDSVTSIDSYAFYNCTSFTSITIPDGVTSIGNSAFFDCDSLQSVTIPDSVTLIGYAAFRHCVSLESVTIGNSVTSIDWNAFNGCSSLENVTIPDSVTYIGEDAFSGCSSLKSVTIPDSVTSIGDGAFYWCGSLESVTIPDSVTSIGSSAFESCGILVVYCNKNSNAASYALDKDLRCVYIDGTDEESIVSGKVGKVTWNLDKRTGLLKLESTGDMIDFNTYDAPWYEHRYYITKLELPKKSTKIGVSAFAGLYRIKQVAIPDSVTSIGSSAFWDCTSLTSITIPDSVTSIGDYTFYYCVSLQSVTIPDSVTSIGDSAFYSCDSLQSVTIPDSVTSIGSYAFEDCDSLQSVTIPDSVTYISSYTFSYCDSLQSVTIPDSVTSIGDSAFYSCNSLQSITIPSSVSYINFSAFGYCTSLENVTFELNDKNQSSITSMPDFTRSKVKEFVLPASIDYIGSNVFPESVEKVTVYNPDCEFNSSCGLSYMHTIIGFKGSTAEVFADKIGADFIDVETVHTHEFKTVKNDKYCSYKKCYCGKFKALKHSYSAYFTADTEPTYTQAGSKSRHCTRAGCNAKTSVTAIPKLVLGVPQNLKASSKDTTITLTWDKVDGAKGYRIYRYNNGWKSVKTTAATSYTVTGLTAGTSYRFAVKAYTKNGTTTIWAPKFSEIKTATAPVPPATVKQTAGTDKTVTVKWDACKNATGYRVYKYNSSTKKWETVVKATTKLTAKISGLSANRQYYIAVKPYTKTESGYVWGTAFTKILVGTAPATPTLKITSTSKGKATIAWNNVAGEKGYQVYYSTSATSGFKKISSYNADVVKAYKTGLTSGKTYYFKVRSYRVYNGIYVYSPYSSVKSVKIK